MNRRRLIASLLVGAAVGWGMSLAPLARPRATLPAPESPEAAPQFFFSPDGRQLVVAEIGRYRFLEIPANHLWDVPSGERIAELAQTTRIVNSVTFSPDNATIAGRQVDGKILTWKGTTGEFIRELSTDCFQQPHPNTQIVYADDGSLLFQDAQVWTVMRHVDTGKVAFDIRPHVRDCNSATINFQNYYLAAGDRKAVVVSLATGEVIAKFESPEKQLDVNGVLSPDGRALALWMRGETARIAVWTPEANKKLPRMTWLNQSWNHPNRLALSNGGKLLAVQSSHHPLKWIFFGEPSQRDRIHVFDTETEREVGRITDGQSAAFSPDNRTLAVALADGSVQLWDLPLRRPWGWIGLAALAASATVYSLLTWSARRRRNVCQKGTPPNLFAKLPIHRTLQRRRDNRARA